MVCACVDIGTNTTRVLVGDATADRLTEILQQRAFTRIGKGMRPGAEIPRGKIEEVAGVVAQQVALARSVGADRVRVVATAAIRGASNRDEFLAAMDGEVEILDGEEEARLAFLGATRTFGSALPGYVGVVDVGGGSTEIAVGTVAGGVTWCASFRVGSGFLADHYLRSDPPSIGELRAVREHADDVFGAREIPRADCAVAVGGSAASLRRLVGDMLDGESLRRAIAALSSAPAAEVADRLALDARRVRLMPAGIVILGAAAEHLRQPLHIGRGGLREGAVLDMARSL